MIISTPDIDYGDAVSNDVIGMYQAFKEEGYLAKMIAVHSQVSEHEVFDLKDFQSLLREAKDIFIYHHSVGWNKGIELLNNLRCVKIIKYHNVTPPAFFEGFADNYMVACQSGRSQLKDLVDLQADLYIGDSFYNVSEFLAIGGEGLKWAVVPPFHHIDRLQLLEPEKGIIRQFRDGWTNLLTVGRVAPNKGHISLIDTFHVYRREYNPESRLLIVGKIDPGLASYHQLLKDKIRELHLEDAVFFTGAVSDSALKAYYRVAHVFMTTSFHEGFCVPLVEAMSLKIPIVAYGSTAVPETVGGAGLVWEECQPELLAASVNRIVRNKNLAYFLGEMGYQRYHDLFSNGRIKARFFEVLRKENLIS